MTPFTEKTYTSRSALVKRLGLDYSEVKRLLADGTLTSTTTHQGVVRVDLGSVETYLESLEEADQSND